MDLNKVKKGTKIKTLYGTYTVMETMKVLNPQTMMEEIAIIVDWDGKGTGRKIHNKDIIEVL